MARFHGISARSRVDALQYGVANAKYASISKIIDDGVDLDGHGPDGETALHVAARLGRFKAAEVLVAAGAKVDSYDKNGYTPMMAACSNGGSNGSRVALLLIDAGASVRYCLPDSDINAMRCAIRRGTQELIEALLDAGAPVNGPRGCKVTPLMMAARENRVDVLQILVDRGANLKRRCKLPWAEGATAAELAKMERRSKSVKFFESL